MGSPPTLADLPVAGEGERSWYSGVVPIWKSAIPRVWKPAPRLAALAGLTALLWVAPFAVRAADPLVVMLESPGFTLDTRLSSGSSSLAALVVATESPAFILDARLSTSSASFAALVVQAESPLFVLDTRLSTGGTGLAGLVVQTESDGFTLDTRLTSTFVPGGVGVVESAAFTLDTRLSTGGANLAALLVQVQSPAFALDTRLNAGSTGLSLVVQAESPAFTLDTRLSSFDSSLALLVTSAASDVFTLDTRFSKIDSRLLALAPTFASTTFTLDTRIQSSVRTLTRLDPGTIGGKVCFSPDGLRLAKTDGYQVLLWNLQTTQPAATFSNYNGVVDTVDFSPLGDQLLVGVEDGFTHLADSATRQEVRRYAAGLNQRTPAVFRLDGAVILSGGPNNTACLWSSSTSNLFQTFTGHTASVTAVALSPLSPNGNWALTGSADKTAILWNAQTGDRVFTFTNHTSLINAVGFSPVTNHCFSASSDGTIRIWDYTTGEQLLEIR